MKKIISSTLVLVLVLSSVTFAFANPWKDKGGHVKFMPPGLAKKGGLPPGIAKKFKDIDGYDWAKDAIERMAEKGVINGVGEEKFAPQRSVTKLEAIVMALRVMGEDTKAKEYEIKIKKGKIEFKHKDSLQEWSYGYVKLAEEKGILDEADVLYFKLNEAATRHEVAKYLVRAMGDEDKAEKHMDEELDYKDESFIPQGSVGYIYVADEEDMMTGYPDGTFRPFDKVTRAQMAVMVSRLEGKVDGDNDEDDDFDIYRGEITDIDGGSRIDWIEIDDDERFDITSDTEVVFEDNEEGDIEDIEIGDDVEIEVNEDDEAIDIVVERELEDKEYEGIVTAIDNDEFSIYALNANKTVEFEIDDDFEIDFEDEDGEIDDLRIGDEVKVVFEDDEVTEVTVDRDIDSDVVYGRLDKIYEDEEQILVYINSKYNTYPLDEDVEIFLNSKDIDLDDLREDDNVRLELDNNDQVIEINAYRY